MSLLRLAHTASKRTRRSLSTRLSFMKRWYTVTGRSCPMRQLRPMACASSAGFIIASMRNTCEAAVKLMPTAPERTADARGQVDGGVRWACTGKSSVCARAARVPYARTGQQEDGRRRVCV